MGVEPRTLIVDIETAPNVVETWRLWDGRALRVNKFSEIICVSLKWLGGAQTTFSVADCGGSQKRFTKRLHKFLSQADILVAHNGKAFDFGRMNSQFIRHGLKPPTPAQRVDTKRAAKKYFGFDSNSLNLLCQYLGIGSKMHTGGYELWEGCLANDPKAWAKMKRYNAYDVKLLEKLYLRLLPWMADHPNVSLYSEGCPKCGSERLQSRGVYRSATRVYNRYQCQDCGGWTKDARSHTRARKVGTNV